MESLELNPNKVKVELEEIEDTPYMFHVAETTIAKNDDAASNAFTGGLMLVVR